MHLFYIQRKRRKNSYFVAWTSKKIQIVLIGGHNNQGFFEWLHKCLKLVDIVIRKKQLGLIQMNMNESRDVLEHRNKRFSSLNYIRSLKMQSIHSVPVSKEQQQSLLNDGK